MDGDGDLDVLSASYLDGKIAWYENLNNRVPTFTSSATFNVPENSVAVGEVVATDVDLPAQIVTYSITEGADQFKFSIDESTGALRFLAAPDFEKPTDDGTDNVYNLTVTASDGEGGVSTQEIAVTVTNLATNSTTNAQTLVSFVNGVVTVTDINTTSNDRLTLSVVQGILRISDTSLVVVLAEGPNVNPQTVDLPFDAITQIVVNTGSGADQLTIDFANGNPIPTGGLNIDGGIGGVDSLLLNSLGTPFDSVAYRPTTSLAGSFALIGEGDQAQDETYLLTFSNLEGVTLDGTQAADLIFDLPAKTNKVSLVDLTGTAGVGKERFTASGLRTLDFSVAGITNLTVNGNTGNDALNVSSLDPAFAAGITLNGGDGNDAINATGS